MKASTTTRRGDGLGGQRNTRSVSECGRLACVECEHHSFRQSAVAGTAHWVSGSDVRCVHVHLLCPVQEETSVQPLREQLVRHEARGRNECQVQVLSGRHRTYVQRHGPHAGRKFSNPCGKNRDLT
ncbi:hypothetical protein MPTK1_5g07030 [Marchantia polymorpha subsp. ruderalis]|uniref:Uncharacterized protein n=2 Tax=Marchantia polymorpha TaxID=3197 RepID=A0AAF6BFS6_MARPO|nr:hypothetical protein MARPO_0136s0018 [Marchantia polymorpha]BBN10860.1 hypothetical protein Mp_5g07030 [Marchantia polymorpha subsp. ruderalis]|eukprot:PTQ29690.1 hypothetical protein MARPO_0136s0018 [Marchantia polymorpha]